MEQGAGKLRKLMEINGNWLILIDIAGIDEIN